MITQKDIEDIIAIATKYIGVKSSNNSVLFNTAIVLSNVSGK